MPKDASSDLAVRKKMRKGTHSCFECRRRKIRCIYTADNPDVCSECFARGSRCVDQEHANPDVIVDHRKNLRERVSRLEALVDSLLEDRPERESPERSSKRPSVAARPEALPPTPSDSSSSGQAAQASVPASERGHTVPLLSVFEDALNNVEGSAATSEIGSKDAVLKANTPALERFTVSCTQDAVEMNTAASEAKRERVKRALLSVLPPYERLNATLNSNSDWWATWRRKCSGTSGDVSLPQFAAQAVSQSNIGQIGTLVLSVGICSDEENMDHYIDTVDRWVLSDDEYATTLEGMECLILKAKWYADVGQPRRSWLANRKGIMYAQLMGLHRKRTSSAAHESIWWSLYHGDRFLSLMLGLPYGVSDAHCDLTLPQGEGPYLPPLIFLNHVSTVAGKVIDRNQGVLDQSISWALQLDQELEELWQKLDPKWIEFSELLVNPNANAAELRERIMGQICYQQIKVYLHLPFMLKSAHNPRYSYSRTACLNGSRDVLRLYQCLRTGTDEPLYECKAIDFLGFTAAVLLMLGLFNYGVTMPQLSSPQEQEEDIRLVEISIDIFRRASTEKGGKVALQSAQVLQGMLYKLRDSTDTSCAAVDGSGPPAEFVIPYFGTISITKNGKPAQPMHPKMPPKRAEAMKLSTAQTKAPASKPSPSSSNPTTYTPTSDSTADNMFSQNLGSTNIPSFNLNAEPFISYDGFYMNNDTMDSQINEEGMNNFPLPANNLSWPNMPMDIDQDWTLFMNDGQGQMPSQGLGDGFVMQNHFAF